MELDNLIFDRTAADVQRVKTLTGKLSAGTATEEEKAEWLAGMKGAYNAADLNRVGAAVVYLTERLYALGYTVPAVPKTDWQEGSFPTASAMEQYIENIHLLRDCVPYAPGDAEKLTFQEANNIEEILHTLERVLLAMQEGFRLRQADTLFMIAGGVFNNAG